MDPRLLDYYSKELRYMHELALEFAEQHPKIAQRLNMHAGEIGDPYVERLLQSSAFVTAHMQMCLDEAFPGFILPLLQTVHANYTCPTPSMAVARLFPRTQGKHAANGTAVPRGTAFISRIPDDERPLHLGPVRREGRKCQLLAACGVAVAWCGVRRDVAAARRSSCTDRLLRQ